MNSKEILSEYARMPKVEINGRIFVDKELFIALINKRMTEEREDCETVEEKSVIDLCRNIVENA